MIDAVVFDVGRVLFHWDLSVLLRKLHSNPDELKFVLANVVTEEWHFQHDAGRPLADMAAERKALFPKYADTIDAYASRFGESIPGPVPGSLEIVQQLDERGVPLFAITNFGAEFWAQFRPKQPVFDLFEDIVVSGVERLTKPDPAIYRLAEKRFGYAPEQMLFIDDNIANIDAAVQLRWHGHHFSNAEALRANLEKHGLLSAEKSPRPIE